MKRIVDPKTGKRLDSIILLMDSARGRYIPQNFANECNMEDWGISANDAECLKAGPDDEQDLYWFCWGSILDNARYNAGGFTWQLYQDGDLWAICPELMTKEEKKNFGFTDDD